MKAYNLRKSGPAESLRIEDVAEPETGPLEVKVELKAIGLNYAEILSRRGQYRWAPGRPYVPGMEGVGEVVEVGSDVTRHQVGDEVIVGAQHGAYAQFICVPEYMAFPALAEFSVEENAALLVNYMTAWVALVSLGRLVSRDTVLIQAAAGGVGTAAIQIAVAHGAEVFGTASNKDKLTLVRKLGAHHAINYVEEDFASRVREISQGKGVDLILEVVGGDVFKQSVKLLNPFGRIIVTGFASISLKRWNPWTWWTTWRDAPKVDVMNMAIGSYGIMGTHIGYLTSNQEIAENTSMEMFDFVRRHGIRPVVGKTFSFEELPEAQNWIESRKSVGKVVVNLRE